MSPESAQLYTYGIYLANGGTPDGFMSMTQEDIEIMYNAWEGSRIRNRNEILEGLGKMINSMFGGKDNGI